MKKYTITDKEWEEVIVKVKELENESNKLKGYIEALEKKLTLYGVVSSFLKKEAINRNTPVDELYLRLDTDTEEIDLHYDEDNEGQLRYMDSYK